MYTPLFTTSPFRLKKAWERKRTRKTLLLAISARSISELRIRSIRQVGYSTLRHLQLNIRYMTKSSMECLILQVRTAWNLVLINHWGTYSLLKKRHTLIYKPQISLWYQVSHKYWTTLKWTRLSSNSIKTRLYIAKYNLIPSRRIKLGLLVNSCRIKDSSPEKVYIERVLKAMAVWIEPLVNTAALSERTLTHIFTTRWALIIQMALLKERGFLPKTSTISRVTKDHQSVEVQFQTKPFL
jgi:hypothetical protein